MFISSLSESHAQIPHNHLFISCPCIRSMKKLLITSLHHLSRFMQPMQEYFLFFSYTHVHTAFSPKSAPKDLLGSSGAVSDVRAVVRACTTDDTDHQPQASFENREEKGQQYFIHGSKQQNRIIVISVKAPCCLIRGDVL